MNWQSALTKNLVVLLALLLGIALYFLYLGLFPAPSTSPIAFDPQSAWQLPQPDLSNLTAGYPDVNASLITHTTIFYANNASAAYAWTYSHHPHVAVVNGSSSLILVSFSSGLRDEDADGQHVLYSRSTDAGLTYSTPIELFPSALGPGQSAQWYMADSLVRAMCSEGFVQTADGRTFALAELYGVSNVSAIAGLSHEGAGWKRTGYGRVALELNSTDGSVLSAPCWLQPSRYAAALAGTPYGPSTPLCDDWDVLVPLLSLGANEPAWSWSLMSDNHQVQAAAPASQITEPTHALPFNSSSLCRFWRLLSPAGNRTLYVECSNSSTETGAADLSFNGWYNGTDELARGPYGPYAAIIASNIPDANSKAFFGAFPPSSGNGRSTYPSWQSPANLTHFLIHNPNRDGPTPRSPLTISTCVDNSTFTAAANLRSQPTSPRYYGLYKDSGYQYPSAAVRSTAAINGSSQDTLLVVYSVNKEDIVISRMRVSDLPRNASALGTGAASTANFGKGRTHWQRDCSAHPSSAARLTHGCLICCLCARLRLWAVRRVYLLHPLHCCSGDHRCADVEGAERGPASGAGGGEACCGGGDDEAGRHQRLGGEEGGSDQRRRRRRVRRRRGGGGR